MKTSTALKNLVKKLEYFNSLPESERPSNVELAEQHPTNYSKAVEILRKRSRLKEVQNAKSESTPS